MGEPINKVQKVGGSRILVVTKHIPKEWENEYVIIETIRETPKIVELKIKKIG